MLFPVRTDRPLRSTPLVNYGLIALNVVIFVLTGAQIVGASMWMEELRQTNQAINWSQIIERYPVTGYYLHPTEPKTIQFLTSMFLHADIWHLLGNMVFLFVFGNSLEDRLGKAGYLFFYLAGGAFSGLGHAMVETSPILGASGAVNAVTGAYLALFPVAKVTVLFFFFIVGFLEVPSMWLILLRFVLDAIQFTTNAGGVAYLAHISGSVYGFLLGMILLWTRILPREPYDMLSLLEHRKRRAEFRALTRKGFEPWQSQGGPRSANSGQAAAPTPAELRIMDKRAEVSRALSTKHLDRAAELYAELLDLDADQVLSPQAQVELANHVAGTGHHELAARMYELYLNTYKSTADREQLELMLALLYIRYLKRGQRARELLGTAMPKLRDSGQISLAQSLLQQLDAMPHSPSA